MLSANTEGKLKLSIIRGRDGLDATNGVRKPGTRQGQPALQALQA